MYKRYFVQSSDLKVGMKIDQTIIDRTERVLVARGTTLNAQMIEALKALELMGVYISDGNESPTAEFTISEKAINVIREFAGDDINSLDLDPNERHQIEQSVDHLFRHYHAPELLLAAKEIVERIWKAILKNKAEVVDITYYRIGKTYTQQHSVNVCMLTMMMAYRCGFSDIQTMEIGIASLLHDIGMLQIPDEILNKAGALTEEEIAILKRHTVFGISILKNKTFINDNILSGVLSHHERINGEGYPMKVKGAGIHPYARMIAVADVFSALIAERPYKKAFTPGDAMEMVMSMTEALDINVLRNLLKVVVLYPKGSDVMLSNREVARVLCNHSDYVMRPTVVSLRTGKVYDLAHDYKCANIIIV